MSNYKPWVSIGLPVYNGERYLAEALDSLLGQTFEDFELIICDNASTDSTQQICYSYADKDKRIRYFHTPVNLGAAVNFRRTFELSSGQYFKWATYDDLHGPTFLERCVDVLDRESSFVLAYPKAKLIDASGRVISHYDDCLHLQSSEASERFIHLMQNIRLCNVQYGLVRSAILKKTALMGAFIGSDRPLLAELALFGKFWEIPEFLFYRRLHSSAYSSQKDTSALLEFHDPKIKYRSPLTTWRHLWADLLAITRAPLDLGEKGALLRFLVRRALSSRHDFVNEILIAVRESIRHWCYFTIFAKGHKRAAMRKRDSRE
jgi:glycosyltransferase involved in cell wall biosynthesis